MPNKDLVETVKAVKEAKSLSQLEMREDGRLRKFTLSVSTSIDICEELAKFMDLIVGRGESLRIRSTARSDSVNTIATMPAYIKPNHLSYDLIRGMMKEFGKDFTFYLVETLPDNEQIMIKLVLNTYMEIEEYSGIK